MAGRKQRQLLDESQRRTESGTRRIDVTGFRLDPDATLDLPIHSLETIVGSTLTRSSLALRKTVSLTCLRVGRIPPIRCEPTQIERVLVELLRNARAAIVREGSIVVRLTASDVDDEGHVHGEPVPYVRIDVTDSGSGMDERTLSSAVATLRGRVPSDAHDGGLALVRALVKWHGGDTLVTSDSHGTRVTLCFPTVTDVAPDSRKRVLLVEDELIMLQVLRLMLERRGFEVVAFADPTEALATFEASHESFAAVVTDYQMPGMDGETLARRIRARAAGIPIVAHSAEVSRLGGARSVFTRMLAKPRETASLADTVEELTSPAPARKTPK